MGNTGGSVEQLVDAVTTVAANHGEVLGLSVLLNDVTDFSILLAWFHYTSIEIQWIFLSKSGIRFKILQMKQVIKGLFCIFKKL